MHERSAQPGQRADSFHPGEIVAVTRVPHATAARPDLAALMHAALRPHAGGHLTQDAADARTFVFDAPSREQSLVFSFHRLADRGSITQVKKAVESLHAALEAIGGDDIEVIGVMPHWHMRAHDAGSGPSPGTYPSPVYPDQVPAGSTLRSYQPGIPGLDLDQTAAQTAVPVAVLDVRADLQSVRARGEQFSTQANNKQLLDTVDWLIQHTPDDAGYAREFAAVEALHPAGGGDATPRGEPAPYPIPDHGLFIAGLIHGIAPRAPISLEPVLDETGVGDLSLLLLGLTRLLTAKQPHEPLIINLSLGFLPHPARLAATWYGLQRANDADYRHEPQLFDPARDQRWVDSHRGEVDRAVQLLQVGLHELASYLSLNNCLVVAAVGNDSLAAVEHQRPRMDARLPARFETVLGVAATTGDPSQAAPYSNLGDAQELGDHVSTFGGGVGPGLQPDDGVIGVYSGEFPLQRPNETGWAFWSGTSFATAIVTGIASNLWARQRQKRPDAHAAEILAEVHALAREHGAYVSDLRTPSIRVTGRWGS